MVINYDIYVGMNDPQMLAHASMLVGLWLLLRHGLAVLAAVVTLGVLLRWPLASPLLVVAGAVAGYAFA